MKTRILIQFYAKFYGVLYIRVFFMEQIYIYDQQKKIKNLYEHVFKHI